MNCFEKLECRALLSGADSLSASVEPKFTITSRGTWIVSLTSASDNIKIRSTNQRYELVQSFAGGVEVVSQMSAAQNRLVKRISVEGNGGNDVIQIDSSVNTATVVSGGSGNDSLTASAGNVTLSGGIGNDRLVSNRPTPTLRYLTAGSPSTVLLSGSLKPSQLVGGAGDDYLETTSNGDTLLGGAGQDEAVGNGLKFSTQLSATPVYTELRPTLRLAERIAYLSATEIVSTTETRSEFSISTIDQKFPTFTTSLARTSPRGDRITS
jgi:Ca2+-binding RTX toxin-like protein